MRRAREIGGKRSGEGGGVVAMVFTSFVLCVLRVRFVFVSVFVFVFCGFAT